MPDELVDKMSNEIAAAEDNLLMWQEKYEIEVRREAVTAQVEAKMALDAAKIRLEELIIKRKAEQKRLEPEHLSRSESLPVPPKFKPALEELNQFLSAANTEEVKPKVTKTSKKKKKKVINKI